MEEVKGKKGFIKRLNVPLVNLVRQEMKQRHYNYVELYETHLHWYIEFVADEKSPEDDKIILEDVHNYMQLTVLRSAVAGVRMVFLDPKQNDGVACWEVSIFLTGLIDRIFYFRKKESADSFRLELEQWILGDNLN